MGKLKTAMLALAACGALSACSNPYDPGQRALGGGAIGAGAGAAIGGLAGGGRGALTGAITRRSQAPIVTDRVRAAGDRKTMKKGILLIGGALAAFCAALPAAPSARAEIRTIANAGLWSTYGGTDDQQRRVCGVATVGGDGRRIDVAQYSADGGIDLSLQKESWSIPPNTGIDMQVQFDRDGAVPQHGVGEGHRVVAHMDFAQSVPFMRALRNGRE
eukprot:gene5433-5488_t